MKDGESAAEKVARDREMWRERAQGHTWATIAERRKIDPRTAQQAVKKYREEEPIDPVTRAEAVLEVLEQHERIIEEYAELIEKTNHPAAKLGAINGKAKAIERLVKIEQSLGLLPNSLALIEQQEFGLWLADALNEAVHRLKIAAPAHVLEPLDDVLLKLESNAEAWRRNQAYARIQRELAAKKAQREIADEIRKLEQRPTGDAKDQRNGANGKAET